MTRLPNMSILTEVRDCKGPSSTKIVGGKGESGRAASHNIMHQNTKKNDKQPSKKRKDAIESKEKLPGGR